MHVIATSCDGGLALPCKVYHFAISLSMMILLAVMNRTAIVWLDSDLAI